ncbi:hypothetical protein ADILRU_0846 [Leifsonia rubra CMS 76R]|nr:hypothetical protein ADILRU_0846 [Leifsonia rubra CMS 76R]
MRCEESAGFKNLQKSEIHLSTESREHQLPLSNPVDLMAIAKVAEL